MGIRDGEIIIPATKLYHTQVMRPEASYELNLLGSQSSILLVPTSNVFTADFQRQTAIEIDERRNEWTNNTVRQNLERPPGKG